MVDLLSQQGQVNVISSPRVSTLNNQKSIIKAAVEEVYFEISISTSTGGPPIITATPRNVTIGVILNVTPRSMTTGISCWISNPASPKKSPAEPSRWA